MTVENVLNFKIIAKLNPLIINNGARLGLALISRLGGSKPPSHPPEYMCRVARSNCTNQQHTGIYRAPGGTEVHYLLCQQDKDLHQNTVLNSEHNIQPRVEINAPRKWQRLQILLSLSRTWIQSGLQVYPGLKLFRQMDFQLLCKNS